MKLNDFEDSDVKNSEDEAKYFIYYFCPSIKFIMNKLTLQFTS